MGGGLCVSVCWRAGGRGGLCAHSLLTMSASVSFGSHDCRKFFTSSVLATSNGSCGRGGPLVATRGSAPLVNSSFTSWNVVGDWSASERYKCSYVLSLRFAVTASTRFIGKCLSVECKCEDVMKVNRHPTKTLDSPITQMRNETKPEQPFSNTFSNTS